MIRLRFASLALLLVAENVHSFKGALGSRRAIECQRRRNRQEIRAQADGDIVPRTVLELVTILADSEDPLWELVRFESHMIADDPAMSSMLHSSVLSHDSMDNALACHIGNEVATPFVGAMELENLVLEMYAEEGPEMQNTVSLDLLASALRDPRASGLLSVLLFHKGFHSLFFQRVSHWLWKNGRRQLARYLQSTNSELLHSDLHPAAKIGSGTFLASGSNVVIGETAEIGTDVSIMQGVTLGGTGKERGDRHPKVRNGAMLGVGASVLGNIVVGAGARVDAKSVVVKPVLPFSVTSGVPAKTVAFFVCDVSEESNLCDTIKDRKLYVSYQNGDLGV